jgi:hypothetical protein
MMRTIKDHLTRLTGKEPKKWSQMLPYVMAAYRATIHETTKCTPNLLFFGRENQMPLHLMYPPPRSFSYSCPIDYTINVEKQLLRAYEFARNESREGMERQKQIYDRKGKVREFKEGIG